MAQNINPREKLLTQGIQALSCHELIMVILGEGSSKHSVSNIARNILDLTDENVRNLLCWTVEDYLSISGLGPSKASTFMAICELYRRIEKHNVTVIQKIYNSQDAFELMAHRMCDLVYEQCWVVYLNSANEVIESKMISQGGIQNTVVDQRIILKYGLECTATSMILLHNHPSGNLQPSAKDIQLTKKLYRACKIMNIKLLDHIIISYKGYFSFSDEKRI